VLQVRLTFVVSTFVLGLSFEPVRRIIAVSYKAPFSV
jgi:hypothetical protein